DSKLSSATGERQVSHGSRLLAVEIDPTDRAATLTLRIGRHDDFLRVRSGRSPYEARHEDDERGQDDRYVPNPWTKRDDPFNRTVKTPSPAREPWFSCWSPGRSELAHQAGA